MRTRAIVGLLLISLITSRADASPDIDALARAESDRAVRVAAQLWDWAELGYLETRSSALLQEELVAAGFRVEAGVAELPTAFVAEAGTGRPVIGILAEFDALPGLSQTRAPRREARTGVDAAHACGHNLFAGGSLAAAVATARWLEASGSAGTLRLYGTPAEEGGSGKVYMVRAGLFDDVDAVLHWHPGDRNDASPARTLANKSAKFRFRGIAAHAARTPERGRSALDGVEAMNFMVNLLREHVPQETRIHYVITEGGRAPNVVPEFAEVFYYVRQQDPVILGEVWERVVAAARAAADGTGTEVAHEVIHGNYSVLPNETLARRVLEVAQRVGGPEWGREERGFAEALSRTLSAKERAPDVSTFEPFEARLNMASTDVGDVSWMVPTAGLRVATWPPGTAPHTWQSAAASGSPVGEAGMEVAARVLAGSAVELFGDPKLLEAAARELREARGPDYRYAPLLGTRAPPLDYRR